MENKLLSQSLYQPSVSGFGAVLKLVETNDELRTLQNRIKVLHMRDHANQNRLENSKEKLEKLNEIRQSHLSEVEKVNLKKEQFEKQRIALNERKVQMKGDHQAKMTSIIGEISSNKAKQYEQISIESQMIDERIKSNKKAELLHKQSVRQHISFSKVQSKENFYRFHDEKVGSLHQNVQCEMKRLGNLVAKKKEEINNLAAIQSEYVKKYSESQAAYKELKSKHSFHLSPPKNSVKSQFFSKCPTESSQAI